MDSESTVLSPRETGGLGTLHLHHPPGTFAPTPATRITLRAVAEQSHHLAGVGVDWGCGIGVLSIATARVEGVERVVGLDRLPQNVTLAEANARANGVHGQTYFAEADSYEPCQEAGRTVLRSLRGHLDFVVANPPASSTNDGFDFRRRVLREGAALLRAGGVLLVQALSAYGPRRVEALAGSEYAYEGIVLRTELVPLDLDGEMMKQQHATYMGEERRGGLPYEFFVGDDPEPCNAVRAWEAHRAGDVVFGRWQVHRFRRLG